MTIAEQLEERGEIRGVLKTRVDTAINLLKEGLDMALIARSTNLEPSKIKELAADLEHSQTFNPSK